MTPYEEKRAELRVVSHSQRKTERNINVEEGEKEWINSANSSRL
jgi:hypothetical protein